MQRVFYWQFAFGDTEYFDRNLSKGRLIYEKFSKKFLTNKQRGFLKYLFLL